MSVQQVGFSRKQTLRQSLVFRIFIREGAEAVLDRGRGQAALQHWQTQWSSGPLMVIQSCPTLGPNDGFCKSASASHWILSAPEEYNFE